MGLREDLKGKCVYFDANIFIYLLEGFKPLEAKLNDIRTSIFHRECSIVTSELTLCEILVPAFASANLEIISTYREFVEASGAFELIPTSRETYIRASLLRAELRLKTPDAIHMATAMENNCDVFLTNDKPIKAPKSIHVLKLS